MFEQITIFYYDIIILIIFYKKINTIKKIL